MHSRRNLLQGLSGLSVGGALPALLWGCKSDDKPPVATTDVPRAPLDTAAFEDGLSSLIEGTPWVEEFDGLGSLLDSLLESLHEELPQTAEFLGSAIDGLSTPITALIGSMRTSSFSSQEELAAQLEAELPALSEVVADLREQFSGMRTEIEADSVLSSGLQPDNSEPLLALQATSREIKAYARSEGAAESPLANTALVEIDKALLQLNDADLAASLDGLETTLDDIAALSSDNAWSTWSWAGSGGGSGGGSGANPRDPFCDVYLAIALLMVVLVFAFLFALNLYGIYVLAGLYTGAMVVGWTAYAKVILICLILGALVGHTFAIGVWMTWDDIVAWGYHCLLGGPHP